MRGVFFSAATIGAVLALAGAAMAADALSVGQSATGALGADSPKDDENRPFSEFGLRLSAGETVEVRVSSEAFDTIVSVGRGAGDTFSFDGENFNDDSGGGTNSRLRFTAPAAGEYTIRAGAFAEDATGDFTVAVETPPPPAVAMPLAIGDKKTGALNPGGARLGDSGMLYDLYTLNGAAGDRLMITMRSNEFDSLLELVRDVDGATETLASNDDGGGELDALLLAELPADGAYQLRATMTGEEKAGGYTLIVERAAPAGPAPRPTPIERGRILTGALADGDAESAPFKRYDLYSLRGRRGETFKITLRSSAFDSLLEAGVDSPAGFAVAASDDDGADEALNAQLSLTFERNGTLLIRTTALSEGAAGDYSLSIE